MKQVFTFTICCFLLLSSWATAPTNPSINLTSGAIEGNFIPFNWTIGNGTYRIVIARKDNPVTAAPANGVDYIANNQFGLGNEISTGQFVVYKGPGNGLNLAGLIPGTTYYIGVFEFNGSGFSTEYLTATFLSGSRTTLTAPTTQVSNFTISNVTGNSLRLNFTNGNGASRLVLAKANSPVNANPIDLVSYFANSQFGSGDQVGSGNYVVAKGSSPVTVTGLQPNTTYYFAAFEFNGNSGPVYLTVAPPVVNQITAPRPSIASSNLSFSAVEGNSMYIGCTPGNGARRLVIAKAGSPVTAVPVDGTTYAPSNVFGSGQQIAPNEFVIAEANQTLFAATNLQHDLVYYFAIFEIDGTGANTTYLTSSFLTGNHSTISEPTLQTSNLSVGSITNNSIVLTWTNGNGTNRIVVARQGSPINALPANYTNYSASMFGVGSQVGAGNYVVYKGPGSTTTITGLSFNTSYYFTIFELNGNTAPVYLTSSPPVANATTSSTPTVPSSNLFFNNTEGNGLGINWVTGNGTGRIIVAKSGSPVTGLPVNGTGYTANNSFGAGSIIAPGEFVVYSGPGSSMNLSNLNIGTTYYFAVFEYNGSGGTSAYLTSSFLTGSRTTLSAPTIQTSSLSFSNIIGNAMQVTMTAGNGQKRIVLAKAGSAVNAVPVDLTAYSASGDFGFGAPIGAGNFVVYAGTATSFSATSLQPNTTYNFAAFEYNGTNGPVYNTITPATGNAITLARPTIASSNPLFSNIEGNGLQLAWTIGNGTKRIVVARQGSPVTAFPADGVNYAASSSFGSGAPISPGQFVMANTSSNFVSITNLSVSTQYYFAIYEYDGTGSNIGYLTSSFASGNAVTIAAPTLQTSSLFFTAITNTSMTLNWTNGNGANRLVILRAGSPVNATPANLTSYFSSTNFPYASQVSLGNFAVFNGNSSSINVFNLQSGVTYHYAIFEFNGNGAPVYLTSSPATGSATTIGPPQTQATNATATAVSATAATINWTNGDGQKRIVLMKANGPVNANPVDGTTYAANSFFGSGSLIGSGNYVVFNGTGNSVTVTNMAIGNTYHVAVFEYNDFGATNVLYYTINPARAVASFTAPQTQATNATAIVVNTTVATFHWTNGNGHKRIVLMKSSSPVNANPVDNTTYTADSVFGSGQLVAPGNYVIYNGVGNSVTVTNLNPITNYHIAVFEYNDFGSGILLYQLNNPARAILSFGSLPVTFIDFTAKEVNNNVVLQWSTAQEFNSARFEIERSSDGHPFEMIGLVDAAGNSSIRRDYSFTDKSAFEGRYYYRLKQIDMDERFIYSTSVSILIKQNASFRLLENPVRHQLRVALSSDVKGPFTISVFDMGGKKMIEQTMKNQNMISINLKALNEGTYTLRLTIANKSTQVRFIKTY